MADNTFVATPSTQTNCRSDVEVRARGLDGEAPTGPDKASLTLTSIHRDTRSCNHYSCTCLACRSRVSLHLRYYDMPPQEHECVAKDHVTNSGIAVTHSSSFHHWVKYGSCQSTFQVCTDGDAVVRMFHSFTI